MVCGIHWCGVVFTLCSLASWVAVETSTPDLLQLAFRSSRAAECKLNCTTVKRRPVCGTDGRTYPSRCALRRAHQCEGQRVRVASKGKCTATARCQEERKQAQLISTDAQLGAYIPECKSDGTYAEVQCHAATGYCWCVTPDGRPIPNTSKRGKTTSCTTRNHQKRRIGSRRKGKRGCGPTDRTVFNAALIELFKLDYYRVPKPTQPANSDGSKGLPLKPAGKESLLDTLEKRVIEWKFTELDTDKDNKLKKSEIRYLKRMVKKMVKPKSCARNFAKACDLDKNKKIERKEWSVCLGGDINRIGPKKPIFTAPTLWNRQPGINKPMHNLRTEAPEEEKEPPPPKNCVEDRKAALDQDRLDPDGRIFIPVCTANSQYKKEQCHTSTGYCWCVDEQTGKPIPGTSTKNQMPDCTNVKPDRELKGCPYIKKKKFLTYLMDKMTKSMADFATNTTDKTTLVEPDPNHSLEERVLQWQLRLFDKNKNLTLEKRELRSLRKAIRKYSKKKKSNRKCARHFVEYCDEDGNKKVTMKEWIDCMGINDKRKSVPLITRKGPNPLTKYLQS